MEDLKKKVGLSKDIKEEHISTCTQILTLLKELEQQALSDKRPMPIVMSASGPEEAPAVSVSFDPKGKGSAETRILSSPSSSSVSDED